MSNPYANPAAQAQAALHRTAWLLARCRHGYSSRLMPQTHWHAQQQAGFLAWLQAGGFQAERRDDCTIENSGMAPLSSAPQRDLHEESKFSLLRIDDAVE
ncbi:hypothetical protein [Duganella callida]|uniref:hypothetical protein n=1 Tax=Duganella callida TaxID=2561932 RepID=UPI001E29E85F|nr:hypothetical protein [Duganella callida]